MHALSVTRRRLVQAVIWLALVAVVAIGFNTASASPADVSTFTPAVSTVDVTPSEDISAPASGVFAYSQSERDMYLQRVILAQEANDSNDVNLLPGYRWRDDAEMVSACSWWAIHCHTANGLAGLLFGISGFIWWAILGLLHLSVSLGDVVQTETVRKAVNNTFASLSGSLISTGLVYIGVIFAVVLAAKAMMSGKITSTFRIVLLSLIPVVGLFAITSASVTEQQTGGHPSGGGGTGWKAGSPLWIADNGLFFVDETAATFAATMGKIPTIGGGTATPYEQLSPSCEAYVDTLYDAFNASETAQDTANKATLVTASRLWEQSFLLNWQEAQYSGAQPGDRIWCHQLEAQASTPRAEQATIGAIAGYPRIDTTDQEWLRDTVIAGSDVDDDTCLRDGIWDTDDMLLSDDGVAWNPSKGLGTCDGVSSYRPEEQDVPENRGTYYVTKQGRRDPYNATGTSGKEFQASVMMWAACSSEDVNGVPRWHVHAAWSYLGDINDQHCVQWWYLGIAPDEPAGGGQPKLVWSDIPSVGGSIAGIAVEAGDNGNKDRVVQLRECPECDDVDDVANFLRGFYGKNGSQRVLNGLIALLSAVMYFWTLGGIAAGTLVAKFGFLVMLALLPGTLFLLSMPGSLGQGSKGAAGKRMLKMTAGYGAANFVLTAVLLLLLVVMKLLSDAFGNLEGVVGGSLLSMSVPLVGVFIVKTIIKKMGMGDIMSGRGALGLASVTAAGMGAQKGEGRKAIDKKMKARSAKAENRVKNRHNRAASQTNGWEKLIAGRVDAAGRKKDGYVSKAKQRASNSSIGQWSATMRQRGGLKSQLTSIAGASALLAPALDRLGPKGRAAAESLGKKVGKRHAGKNMSAADQALAASRAQRDFKATTGGDGLSREDALRARFDATRDIQAGVHQRELSENGEALRTVDGQGIFGFYTEDHNGHRTFLTAAEAGFDPVTLRPAANVQMATEPILNLTQQEMDQARVAYGTSMGIDPVAVQVSRHGTPPVIAPWSPSDELPRPPQTASLEAVQIAADQGAYFLDGAQRKQVLEMLSPAAQAQFWSDMQVEMGFVDPVTGEQGSALRAIGIDPNSPRTQEILLDWQQGNPTVLDERSFTIPAATFTAMMASAVKEDEICQRREVTVKLGDEIKIHRQERIKSADEDVQIMNEFVNRLDTLRSHAAQYRNESDGAIREQIEIEIQRELAAVTDRSSVQMLDAAHGSVLSIPALDRLERECRASDPNSENDLLRIQREATAISNSIHEIRDVSSVLGHAPDASDVDAVLAWAMKAREEIQNAVVTPAEHVLNSPSVREVKRANKRPSSRSFFNV